MSRYPETILLDEVARRLAARRVGDGRYAVEVGDETIELQAERLGDDGGFCFVHDGVRRRAYALPVDGGLLVRVDGQTWRFDSAEQDRDSSDADAGDPGLVVAPMTGTVVKVLCEVGDSVSADDDLVVLSAMKMEHKLSAASDARVASIEVEAGATVDAGALLIRLEVTETTDAGS